MILSDLHAILNIVDVFRSGKIFENPTPKPFSISLIPTVNSSSIVALFKMNFDCSPIKKDSSSKYILNLFVAWNVFQSISMI